MLISDWSSDVCSSVLDSHAVAGDDRLLAPARHRDAQHVHVDRRHLMDDRQHERAAVDHHGLAAVAGAHEGDLLRRAVVRSEEHTSELQSLMRISYAVFCLKNKNTEQKNS